MDNPFQINYPDQADVALVKLATAGDKKALQNLVTRHQVFVYNLALKMTQRVEEADLAESIEELRISCTAGMLLCLDREQRMIYILGEMFDIDHKLGSEILGISPGNFRIRLMRARQDLYNWMNKRCGLVNKSNPCRCAKKTRAYIEAGHVDPDNLKFNTRYKKKIYELSKEKAVSISNTVEDLYASIFQDHPLQEPITTKKIVDEI